jgi:uroporphyrinogen decarboxylase
VPIDEEISGPVFSHLSRANKSYLENLIHVRKRVLDLDVVVVASEESGCMACGMPINFRKNIIQDTPERIIFKDPNGITWLSIPSEGREIWIDNPIKECEQMERFEFANLDLQQNYQDYEKKIRALKNSFFVFGDLTDPFELYVRLRGHNHALKDIYRNPNFAKKLLEKCHKNIMKIIKLLVELDVDGIYLYGDVAFKTGPMMSPRHYKEFILPFLKEEINYCRKKHIPTRFHSDGNITKIIPLLIEAGFNAVDPLEPTSEMKISTLKERFGDEICLIGNVDHRTILTGESIENIVHEVKNSIESAAPSGGYILHSGGSIGPDVPLQNLFTMIKTGRKYGKYR